jgi:small-conductance mechanosensitive channel
MKYSIYSNNKILASFFYFIGLALLVFFLFIALFGVSLSMATDSQGNMTGCPWMSEVTKVCPMDVAEHIAEWQRLLTVTPQQNLSLLMLALMSFTAVLYILNHFIYLEYLFTHYYQRYKREHPDISLFNYLNLIFARGILQPKLYA